MNCLSIQEPASLFRRTCRIALISSESYSYTREIKGSQSGLARHNPRDTGKEGKVE